MIIRREPEYSFVVDGEEFPWYISENGPHVTKLGNELYGIKVEIYCVDRETKRYLRFEVDSGEKGWPPELFFIGDREFAWAISDDGFTYEASLTIIPTVTLTFFARSVDDDGWVDDARQVRDIGGTVLAPQTKGNPHGTDEALWSPTPHCGGQAMF